MQAATAPRPCSPAQAEAARRNGARSKGPVTAEGKARSSRNALKHGLTAMHHLVLEDEVPDALEALIGTIAEETGAATEVEARLARRLAIAFWKGERAERMEVALLDAAPKVRPPTRGGTWEQADPLTTFDVKRFNAVRGHQAAQGREISRCLKELRQLRKDVAAPAGDTHEPEAGLRNEPDGPPPPANDDAPTARRSLRNEPDAAPHDPFDDLPEPTRAELDRLLAADDWPGLSRLGATGALLPLGLGPEDLASPQALGRTLYRRPPKPTGPTG
jgi:hypothetical protein